MHLSSLIMDKAVSLRYDLQIPIGELSINLDAYMLYFPDEKVLMTPMVDISNLGHMLLYQGVAFMSGEEAEAQYSFYNTELQDEDFSDVEVPEHMLKWVKNFDSNPDPSEELKADFYRFLTPNVPESTEAEIIEIAGEGLKSLISAIYVPSCNLLLKYDISRTEKGLILEGMGLLSDQEAVNYYLWLSNNATYKENVPILNPFLDILRNMTEANAQMVLYSLDMHVKHLYESLSPEQPK